MNPFDKPSWADTMLGNKVTYPSFGTAQPTNYIEGMKASIQATGAAILSTVAKIAQEDAQEAFKQDMAQLIRKKPGPKPGSKRKVK